MANIKINNLDKANLFPSHKSSLNNLTDTELGIVGGGTVSEGIVRGLYLPFPDPLPCPFPMPPFPFPINEPYPKPELM